MNQLLLKDKIILLTGASSGLGKVFAETFVAEGATTIITGRGKEALDAVAAELNAKGPGKAYPVVADAASKEDTVRLFDTIQKEFGRLDGLVTNAARNSNCISIEVADDDYIDSIIDTNLKSVLRYDREAMKIYLQQNSGVILNIGSNNVGRPICDAVYCAGKYALWGVTRQMAMRTVGTGIRCNLLNPGSFPSKTSVNVNTGATHMYDAAEKVFASGVLPVNNGSMVDIMKAKTNRAVPVDLEQVAFAAVYLLSDLARDVTGQVFTVDRGGYM